MLNKGTIPSYETAMVKMFASELEQRIFDVGLRILSLYGQLHPESKGAELMGWITQSSLHAARVSITRGSSEVMRNIIALRGLELPRG